jgi:isopentenyl phosphate kinase
MAETIVIKLGGSVITYKDRKDFPLDKASFDSRASDYIRTGVLERLAEEVSHALSKTGANIALVNGAGPFGHQPVWAYVYDKKNINPRFIHYSVKVLNKEVIKKFEECGVKLEPIHPIETCVCTGKGSYDYKEFYSALDAVLEVPSTYGDVVPTLNYVGRLKTHEVLSGDNLFVALAEYMHASKVILVSDIDGLYYSDPKTNKDAKLIKIVDANKGVSFDGTMTSIDVTSGISGKLGHMINLAKNGIKGQIVNGLKKGKLEDALLGNEDIGTLVMPVSSS